MFHCSVFCAELLCTKFLQQSPLDIQQNQSKRPTHWKNIMPKWWKCIDCIQRTTLLQGKLFYLWHAHWKVFFRFSLFTSRRWLFFSKPLKVGGVHRPLGNSLSYWCLRYFDHLVCAPPWEKSCLMGRQHRVSLLAITNLPSVTPVIRNPRASRASTVRYASLPQPLFALDSEHTNNHKTI